ncbi:MAG: hypothetical protein LC640_09220 [Frankia sp.]|nr:hypothetical protein [Frankia sp.]
MNRRGFFGTIAALPALLRGGCPLPPVAAAAPVALSGMSAWLPVTVDPCFGIDRTVTVLQWTDAAGRIHRSAPITGELTPVLLLEACNRARRETW